MGDSVPLEVQTRTRPAIATLGSTLSFFFFFLWPWHKFHQKSPKVKAELDRQGRSRIRMDKASGKKKKVTLPTSSRWSTKISKHSFLVCASTASETAHPRVCQRNPNQCELRFVHSFVVKSSQPSQPTQPSTQLSCTASALRPPNKDLG